ncbi:hypothetical protein QQ008_29685 [Fulvivirgaceae bacterium BMA10]|uniref:Uncharacterized protein n=1 Tax=Splendidivirga corallicola TaxID=3051826 RepID=A0ABT8L184_9BACT|nr:hypothetical protein [Fulvivirgaceae bacterium BMA10]
MKSELDEIIEYHQLEIVHLEKTIDQAIQESDYISAHHHWEILWRVKNNLRVFEKIKDSNYERKQLIERLKRMDRYGAFESYEKYADRSYPTQPKKKFIDSQEIDDKLLELQEGKLRGLKLYLIKKQNLFLEFTQVSKNLLRITITPYDKLTQEFSLMLESCQSGLESVGFKFNKNENHLEMYQTLENFKDLTKIKTILARMMFDVFSFNWDKPAHLSYY